MKLARVAVIASLMAVPAAATLAPASPQHATTPLVVVVNVPKPWYAPDFLVVRKMRAALPQYQTLPGLLYKIFSLSQADGRFGGIYLWSDQDRAHAWFDAAWFDRVRRERGAQPQVREFDAPLILDNTPGGTPAGAGGDAVATLVMLPIPARATREQLVEGFRASLPVYRKAPGLLRKYFLISADGHFGGAYLWRDQASARRWFDASWHRRTRTTYGADPTVEWFDAPILMPSKRQSNIEAARRIEVGP